MSISFASSKPIPDVAPIITAFFTGTLPEKSHPAHNPPVMKINLTCDFFDTTYLLLTVILKKMSVTHFFTKLEQ
jgi:hypothetical protein